VSTPTDPSGTALPSVSTERPTAIGVGNTTPPQSLHGQPNPSATPSPTITKEKPTGVSDNTLPFESLHVFAPSPPLNLNVQRLNKIDGIIEDLKHSMFAFYAATPGLASNAEFFMGGPSGDIAIHKNGAQHAEELLLSGIFEIDWQNFFMGPEGGYMPGNLYNRNFVDTKLKCYVIPVQRDSDFATAREDFNAIVANIRALEKLVTQKKGNLTTSCLRDSGGQIGLCLNHALFMVCPPLNMLTTLLDGLLEKGQ